MMTGGEYGIIKVKMQREKKIACDSIPTGPKTNQKGPIHETHVSSTLLLTSIKTNRPPIRIIV